MSIPEFSVESLKILLVVALLTLTASSTATNTGFVVALPGVAPIVTLDLAALLIGRPIPLGLPALAYAMVFAFALALPFSLVQAPFLVAVGEIDFLATATPIPVYTGLPIDLQIGETKEVNWELVLVAVLVFFGMFFGSTLISQAALSAQGII